MAPNKKDQKVMNYIAETLIGMYSNGVEDGYNMYKMSYVQMAKDIYNEAINLKGTYYGVGGISEGARFQGKKYLKNMVLVAMLTSIMEWGVPLCHDGTDTMKDVMDWATEE